MSEELNNENSQNISPEEIQEPFEDITLSDAITGVFTEPGVTFEAVSKSSKKNYWIVPIIISIIVSIAAGYFVMKDEELSSEIKSKQKVAAKERLDEAVKSGKLTQEQANEQLEKMDKFFDRSGPFFIIISIAGPLLTIVILLFLRGLIFWGGLKIIKAQISYMMVICILGLTSLIDSIQTLIGTVLAILTGKLRANIGLGLLFSEEAVGKNLMKLFGHIDVFNFWYFIVLGIGFAMAGKIQTSKSMVLVLGLWIIWILLTSFLNIGFFGM
jgi:hypothetical protein